MEPIVSLAAYYGLSAKKLAEVQKIVDPYFRDQTLKAIQNVQLIHGYHLYWPDLDIDLETDNLENPEKYPLKSKPIKTGSSRNPVGRSA